MDVSTEVSERERKKYKKKERRVLVMETGEAVDYGRVALLPSSSSLPVT